MTGRHLSSKKKILPTGGSHAATSGKSAAKAKASQPILAAAESPAETPPKKAQAPKPPKAPKAPKPPKAPKAAKAKTEKKVGAMGRLFRFLLGVLIAAVLLVNIFTYVFSVVSYHGDSMEPTLSGGETLVILRTAKIEEGDIIAFYYNNKVIVRRVICTGNKQISVSDEGVVTINGEVIMEDYVSALSYGQCDISYPFSVPGDHYFVMGDNRAESMDSRLEVIGTISPDRVIGKIIFVK